MTFDGDKRPVTADVLNQIDIRSLAGELDRESFLPDLFKAPSDVQKFLF